MRLNSALQVAEVLMPDVSVTVLEIVSSTNCMGMLWLI